MKKQIAIICSFIFAILMIPVVLVSFAFGIAPQYDRSFYGGMAIKYDRLRAVEQKKIVVIGGSSVAFGIRSDILEKELGMPVVNFGLYANLGTKYMLDVAEKHINAGDIVIITPEQEHQALSLYFNGEAAWYSVDGRYGILSDVSTDNVGDLMKSFIKFTSGKFKYWQSKNKPDPDGVYNVESFDAYGDIVYDRPYNTMKDGCDFGTPISFEEDVIDAAFINYINDYNKRLEKKGATVYYAYCPMNEKALAPSSDDKTIKEYYDALSDRLDVAVIGNPKTHLMDSDWFYDSNFHLNSAGAIYYTALFAQELKAELGDFSPVTTEIPDKPVPPAEGESNTGTLSDDLTEAAKIFGLSGVEVTAENGQVVLKGSWTITGLTEYGRTLDKIIIPDTLAGIPVKYVAEDCFKGDTALVSVTVGANVTDIGTGAFDGCTSLGAVYMRSTDPGRCHVSADLLNDAPACRYYVPELAYNDYVLDYFWGAINTARPLRKY